MNSSFEIDHQERLDLVKKLRDLQHSEFHDPSTVIIAAALAEILENKTLGFWLVKKR